MNKNDVNTAEISEEPTTIKGLNVDTRADEGDLDYLRSIAVSAMKVPSEFFSLPPAEQFAIYSSNTESVEKIKAINPTIIVENSDTENPYYSIMYWDVSTGITTIGYSSYELSYVRKWLDELFEPIDAVVGPIEFGYWDDGVCSRCGSENHDCPNYCPECGAEMVL